MTKNTNNTKQAFWIALGSLFSFGFGIISSVVLSRYLPKADYGTFKQTIYIYGTLLTVFTLGLPKAYSYFLPRVDIKQAKSLIKKISRVLYIMGGLLSIFLFVLSEQIANLLNNPDLSLVLKIFSPVPFLMLPTMGLEGILATYRMTVFMAIFTVMSRSMMLVCVTLPVILMDGGYIQAVIGFVAASFVTFGLTLYFKNLPVKNKGDEDCEIRYHNIFQFSLPLLYASLWGVLISSTDQFFISRYFGKEVFAEFANGSLQLPFVGMIVGAVSGVLSPIFSRLSYGQNSPKNEIFLIWRSVFEKSALLIYPLLLYVLFFAKEVMVILYGEQYENSAIYFQIKAVSNFFAIIVYAPLLINIGKVNYYANVHAFIAILVIALEYISVLTVNSPYAISGISLFCQLLKTFLLLYAAASFFELKVYQLFPIKLLATIIVPSFLVLYIIKNWLLKALEMEDIYAMLFGGLIYLGFYVVFSWALSLNYMFIIKQLFMKAVK